MVGLKVIQSIPLILLPLFTISPVFAAEVSYHADLVGEAEVPPLFSESQGSALVSGNDNSLTYRINVSSLDKVTSAGLFRGDPTEGGQLLVSLLNLPKPSGVIDGGLVEGTINSASIIPSLANLTNNCQPVTITSATPASKLDALIDLMNQNMTFINIHTSKFPSGELRGTLVNQVKPAGGLYAYHKPTTALSASCPNQPSIPIMGNLTNMTTAVPAAGNLPMEATNMNSVPNADFAGNMGGIMDTTNADFAGNMSVQNPTEGPSTFASDPTTSLKEFGVFFGPIQKHFGVFHNENGVFIPWKTLCPQMQAYLLQSCSSLTNPDGSLTSLGDTAVGCITNGAIITGAAAMFNLPVNSISGILGALAKPTGCDNIVNLNAVSSSPYIGQLMDMARTYGQ